jgi:alpha-mannosidase
LNRASAERLSQAETVFALRGPAEHPADKLLEAWKNVLLYSEHTWGADRSISQPDDPFTQDQWKTKQGFALAASQQSSELLTSAVLPLRRAVSSLDIYNTTQWSRTNIVALPREMGASGVADERGHILPSQRLSNGELVFIAKDIPAYAAKRYRILWRRPFEQGKARATGTVLETSTLRVEVDAKTGAVKSLKLAGVEHDFVDSSAPVALNDYRYVLGEDVAGATTNGPVKITVTADGPLVAALRIESDAPGCNTLVREIRVVDGVDRVEIADTVDRKAVREKDAVHFGFGFNVPAGKIHMETPWGVVRPNEDQLPGSNHNWFTVQRWVDVSNTDSGITLAPVEAPLIEIGGITAALLGSVAEDRWLTATADSPTIYSWAQNNHWHTNYKADQPGETTFHYVLWPHAGGYSPADAARFGLEVSRPLIAAPSDARKKLPAPLLEVSNPNVLVETVKVSDDNRALVLRLFGVSGKNETVTLKWKGWRPRAMWRTDAGEKRLGRLPDGPIDVPAYGLVQGRADR